MFGGIATAGGLVAALGTVPADAATRAVGPRKLLWRAQAGSGADSTPAVIAADGVVYAAIGGHSGTEAIDAATGKLAWQTQGPEIYAAGATAAFGFEVTSSRTTVVALNATSGQTLWTHDAGKLLDNAAVGWLGYAGQLVYIAAGTTELTATEQPSVRALNAQTGQRVWGVSLTAASQEPAVAGGIVYACTSSRVVALNGATGARQWESAELSGIPGNLLAIDGVICGSAITNSLGLTTFGLDGATGRRLWHAELDGFAVAAANGLIFFMSSSITGGGAGQSTVWARHAQSAKLAWTRTFPQGAPYAAGGVLYMGCGDGKLYAVAPGTGHTLWTYRLATAVADVAAADGVVYAADANGTVYAFQA